MKFLLLLTALLAVVMFTACKRTTTEEQGQGREVVNRNTGVQAEGTQVEGTQSEAAPLPDAPPAGSEAPPSGPPVAETKPAQPAAIKPPPFLNLTTGEIDDLPSYPGGSRMSVQYGPVNGMDAGFIMLTTNAPVDQIAAFYEKTVKSQGWSVSNRLADPEIYRLTLKKDAFNEAIVQVEKDPQSGNRRIVLTRLQKPKQPAEQPKHPAEQPKLPNP